MKYGFYGLKDLPEAFQRMMDTICCGIPGLEGYFDDLLIVSDSLEQHRLSINELFRRLRYDGLKMNPKKCEFLVEETVWLGYRLTREGFQMPKDRIEAIKGMASPRSAEEVRSVLGLFNFFQSFLPNDYATTVSILRGLTKAKTSFRWTSAEESAFRKAKEMVCNSGVLKFFDPTLRTILTCDASTKGTGAVLTQVQRDGSEAAIAFISHALPPGYDKYHINDLELFACVKACESLDLFLRGIKFTIRTDSTAILNMLNDNLPANRSKRVIRWGLALRQYDATLEHRRGKIT